SELLAGTSVVIQVECSDPERARELLRRTTLGSQIEDALLGISVTLPAGSGRDAIAEIARVLVEGGVAIYRLQPIQTSLESWFLQVTSRLGASE
ncbi:MAG TPA: hypothetical protein VKR27_05195, partial [Acidimicrobiales bacterium]|nr:hypothetical protein [Acidimicrobiales bacterium]